MGGGRHSGSRGPAPRGTARLPVIGLSLVVAVGVLVFALERTGSGPGPVAARSTAVGQPRTSAPGADAQELLKLASAGARLSKFELMEPSLEEIFIDAVSKPAVEKTNA